MGNCHKSSNIKKSTNNTQNTSPQPIDRYYQPRHLDVIIEETSDDKNNDNNIDDQSRQRLDKCYFMLKVDASNLDTSIDPHSSPYLVAIERAIHRDSIRYNRHANTRPSSHNSHNSHNSHTTSLSNKGQHHRILTIIHEIPPTPTYLKLEYKPSRFGCASVPGCNPINDVNYAYIYAAKYPTKNDRDRYYSNV